MQEELENYQGQPLTFKVPSGHTVTIREQNGDDDEVLSTLSTNKGTEQLDNTNKFISKIVVGHDYADEKRFLTVDQVEAMRLKDKYYILLKSRIHSNGSILVFKTRCTNKNCKHEIEAEEDLNILDTDLSNYRKWEEGDERPQPYKYAITPYPNQDDEAYHEFTIASGKTLRFRYLNGTGEKKGLEAYQGTSSINTELQIRELSIKMGDKWQILGSYAIFGPSEMKEIRARVKKLDSQFIMVTEVTCPKCENEMMIPLNSVKDFFYPTEI